MYRCAARAPVLPCAWRGRERTIDSKPVMNVIADDNVRASDEITIKVGLDARSYEIAIGRGVLPSLGHRIKALRPGARTAIVTDHTVAHYWLKATEQALAEAG